LDLSRELKAEAGRGCMGIKPGWVRVNFNYFITETVFDYVLDAVEIVASDGWKLLPQYRFDEHSGLWRHAHGLADPPLSLDGIRYERRGMVYDAHRHHEPESRLADYLDEARSILAGTPRSDVKALDPDLDRDFESLRWFPLPSEALAELQTYGRDEAGIR